MTRFPEHGHGSKNPISMSRIKIKDEVGTKAEDVFFAIFGNYFKLIVICLKILPISPSMVHRSHFSLFSVKVWPTLHILIKI